MARALGRVIVAKVDNKGDKIKNFKLWRKKNPKAIYFDSHPEWEVWKYLKGSRIPHVYHPSAIELMPAMEVTEFYHPRKNAKDRTPKIKKVTQKKMEYTPDFYLPEYECYIEVKGYADEQFKMRWKLFKALGFDGFIVYSLAEFKALFKQLRALRDAEASKASA